RFDTQLLIRIARHDKQGWQDFALGDFIGLEFDIIAAGRLPRSIVPLELTFERALPVLDVLRHAHRGVYYHRRRDRHVRLEESKQGCGSAGREAEKPNPFIGVQMVSCVQLVHDLPQLRSRTADGTEEKTI